MNIDNIVIGGLADNKGQAYFYASSSDTDAAARIAAGDIVITNVKFDQMGTGNTDKAVSGLSFTENRTQQVRVMALQSQLGYLML